MTAAPTWGVRLVGIEGLRGLAAMTVVFHHTFQYTNVDGSLDPIAVASRHGLTLFFALSGFLLYRPFVAAILSGERMPRTVRFYSNRWLRIVPGYVAIFLLANFVLQSARTVAGNADGAQPEYGMITDPLTLILNVLMLQSYTPKTVSTGIPPAWSLSVEIVFYLMLPWLAIGAAALLTRIPLLGWKALLLPPATLLVTGAVGKAAAILSLDKSSDIGWQYWGSSWHAVLERSFLVQADLFSWGMVAAIIVVAVDMRRLSTRSIGRFRVWSGVIALTSGLSLALPGLLGERIQDSAIALGAAGLILFVILPSHRAATNRVARTLEFAPFKYLGLISFSVYLWHVPVAVWLGMNGLALSGGDGALLANFLLISSIAVALGSITYWLVEHPAMKLKRPAAKPRTSQSAREDAAVEDVAAP